MTDRTYTTQQTAKRWKAMYLIAIAVLLGGILLSVAVAALVHPAAGA